MQFRVLGPVEVEIEAANRRLSRHRERRLLGLLLLDANRVVPAGRLADLLWDGDPPENARRVVHSHISRLRAVLTSGGRRHAEVAFIGDGYRISADPELVDAHRFRTLLSQAGDVVNPVERIRRLRVALDLWRGPVLADAASDWLRARVGTDLEEQRLMAIEDFMVASLAQRREREILPELARVSGENPDREGLVALHMRALYQAGRKVDALEVFARARAHLAGAFGLDPGPVLRELHQAVLRDELVVPRDPAAAAAGPARPAPAGPRVVPRQLPADIACFTGRTAHLEQLDSVLSPAADAPASVVVTAICGSAGVGKTALALRWAHRVASRFPDGQLYVNLRGFDPTGSPMSPAEAARAMLEALDVPPQRIPVTVDAKIGLYRSLLAGRRMLVLLDNARDADLVRPLLPGAPGSLALVTSRDRLTGLAVREGAQVLTLDALTAKESRQLLENRLGVQRAKGESAAIDDIARQCAGLPLALAVVAARAAQQPASPLRVLADGLREAERSLDALRGSR